MDISRLEQMLTFHSVVSNPHDLADWLITQLQPHADRIERDRRGTIYAWRGESPKAAIFCHLDSIGFMVEECYDSHVKVVPLGGPAAPPYTPMVIEDKEGRLHNGTLLVQGEGKTRQLLIDLWEPSNMAPIRVGDLAAFAPNFRVEEGRIHSRWLDNKLGTWAALEAWLGAEAAVFVATMHEEATPQDAGSAALRLSELALAIVVDITYADSPGNPYLVSQGDGPALTFRDSTVYDRRWLNAVRNLAEQSAIPLQPEVTLGGSSDAEPLMTFGMPAIFIGIPIRYAHTPAEMAQLSDVETTVTLLEKITVALQRNELS